MMVRPRYHTIHVTVDLVTFYAAKLYAKRKRMSLSELGRKAILMYLGKEAEKDPEVKKIFEEARRMVEEKIRENIARAVILGEIDVDDEEEL